MKNKQFKTVQVLTQTFSPDKIGSHENFSTILLKTYYLNACCLIHVLLYNQKYMGNGIQTTVKANELFSVMTVCVNSFHNDVMTCMLEIG